MDVDAQQVAVADDEDGTAERCEVGADVARVRLAATDDKLGAVTAFAVPGLVERGRLALPTGGRGGVGREVDIERVVAQRAQQAFEDDGEAEAAGIDDAGLPQRGQQVWGPLDSFVGGGGGAG